MQLRDDAGGCKGKIGKKGNKWLIESRATEESCKLACLEDKGCKFATLRKKGKPRKWKCASFKKCKMNKNKKDITFKKSKAEASEADEQEESSAASCGSESLTGDGSDYRGCQTQTRGGLTCQEWSAQSPHAHTNTPTNRPNSGLESNYCRNPDGTSYIWCYTTSSKRWDFCDPISDSGEVKPAYQLAAQLVA